MNVSRETRLAAFEGLVRKWNPSINLVAPSTVEGFDSRHRDDCLQLATLAQPRAHWADLGSGAGLPGLVVAIALADTPIRFTLVESDQRKAEFLRQAARQLSLPHVTVVNLRIETLDPLHADTVSVRALAVMPKLMPYLARHLDASGTAWVMKGRNWRKEVETAHLAWRFDVTPHASVTDRDAAILEITGIRPCP